MNSERYEYRAKKIKKKDFGKDFSKLISSEMFVKTI